jgi:hypothetical protein
MFGWEALGLAGLLVIPAASFTRNPSTQARPVMNMQPVVEDII